MKNISTYFYGSLALVAVACGGGTTRSNVDAPVDDNGGSGGGAGMSMTTGGRGGAGGSSQTGGAGGSSQTGGAGGRAGAGGGGMAGAGGVGMAGAGGMAGRGGSTGMGGMDAGAPDRQPMDMMPDRAAREASPEVSMMSADTACTALAASRCAKIKMCTTGFVIDRDYGSDANCLAELKADCLRGAYYPWTDSPPTRTMACATALAAQPCADWFAGVVIPTCATGPGGIEDGGICLSSRQCVSGACQIAATALCGSCLPKVATAGACMTTDQCPDGEVCAANACVKPLTTVGAACGAAKPCASDLSCVGAVGVVDGACQKRLVTEGADCDASLATKPACESRLGLFCKVVVPPSGDGGVTDAGMTDGGVITVGKCTKLTLAAVGAVCGTTMPDGTSVGCSAGARCVRPLPVGSNMRPLTGTCVANVAATVACNTNGASGAGCNLGLRCVATAAGMTTGTCVARVYSACP